MGPWQEDLLKLTLRWAYCHNVHTSMYLAGLQIELTDIYIYDIYTYNIHVFFLYEYAIPAEP